MKKIVVINGPNLNLLGEREPGVYGKETLDIINQQIKTKAEKLKIETEFFQSNVEGHLIDKLHEIREQADGIILNAGALTHYSYALRDAIAAIRIPVVEVHCSNTDAREEFRQRSVIGAVCAGSIRGFGKNSYLLAVDALYEII